VAPDHVVISCGRGNVFQFPHPEALERIGDEREVWRTDQRGAITVVTDGEELEVRAFLEAR
jgi:competence protein ComEC